jgi:hypothetical protein
MLAWSSVSLRMLHLLSSARALRHATRALRHAILRAHNIIASDPMEGPKSGGSTGTTPSFPVEIESRCFLQQRVSIFMAPEDSEFVGISR